MVNVNSTEVQNLVNQLFSAMIHCEVFVPGAQAGNRADTIRSNSSFPSQFQETGSIPVSLEYPSVGEVTSASRKLTQYCAAKRHSTADILGSDFVSECDYNSR